jgi:hypothetical protein|tara:strand:+ start:934 stop:1107 length:174 start_codon:yes stop_codon:yes gene_type:complete
MKKYVVTFGYHEHEGFDGYQIGKTKPFYAKDEEDAYELFEATNDMNFECISIKLIND